MHEQHRTEQDQLVVLYTLRSAGLDLREDQLAKILASLRLMDFFDLKKALQTLAENGQVSEVLTIQGPTYHLTGQGGAVIAELETKVLLSTRESLDGYMAENRTALERESMYLAAYTRMADGQYRAQARIDSDNNPVFQLSLLVGTKEEAQTFVRLWPVKGEQMYQKILLELTIDENNES